MGSTSEMCGTSANTRDLWALAQKFASASVDSTRKDVKSSINNINSIQQGIESSLIFVGCKASGKTTIILRLADRDEAPAPTSALEYTFARKTRGMTGAKDLIHIWEVAGGTRLSDLVKIPITDATIHTITPCVVLDLSRPEGIITTLDHFLALFNERVETLLHGLEKRGSKRPTALRKHAWKKYGGEHPDQSELKPSPIPLVVIGTKYDLFRDFEPETRKLVCKTLRYAAHINGASLIFTSTKDESSMERCRQLLYHHGFKANAPKAHIVDHNKPLMVLGGADSLSQIGHPAKSSDKESIGRVKALDWNTWKAIYSQRLPQNEVQENDALKDFVDLPKYREAAIDNVYAQKKAEFLQRQERLLHAAR
ncbi:hypothetical protein SeMB42_g02012 [Synchytrium endobioticum]|uniref:Cytoplasmic dynein 2 light intermediate chain 1 n=1 Tax=Synchytrium endobioticum TaxID=286115 RepID=A0A507DHX4_9FUNG|nr:hypothetical protein SeLEV6574_g02307 [Synchytrium endobioticum]TPX51146.1 hypothetical protein SeMB42_g02012 [Synchytrium endobioticum]